MHDRTYDKQAMKMFDPMHSSSPSNKASSGQKYPQRQLQNVFQQQEATSRRTNEIQLEEDAHTAIDEDQMSNRSNDFEQQH